MSYVCTHILLLTTLDKWILKKFLIAYHIKIYQTNKLWSEQNNMGHWFIHRPWHTFTQMFPIKIALFVPFCKLIMALEPCLNSQKGKTNCKWSSKAHGIAPAFTLCPWVRLITAPQGVSETDFILLQIKNHKRLC